MTEKALLFLDVLGVKARWAAGGKQAVMPLFDQFRSVVFKGLRENRRAPVVDGLIEGDAAALLCPNLRTAILVGRETFRAAFRADSSPGHPLWLRGVVLPVREDVTTLRVATSTSFSRVVSFDYASPLLDAIAAERSGFKGMRLVVSGFSGQERNRAWGFPVGADAHFHPFKTISPPGYPAHLGPTPYDFLWMASRTEKKWQRMQFLMAQRFRRAAVNDEEFVHAAATLIVFHHCGGFAKAVKASRGKDLVPSSPDSLPSGVGESPNPSLQRTPPG